MQSKISNKTILALTALIVAIAGLILAGASALADSESQASPPNAPENQQQSQAQTETNPPESLEQVFERYGCDPAGSIEVSGVCLKPRPAFEVNPQHFRGHDDAIHFTFGVQNYSSEPVDIDCEFMIITKKLKHYATETHIYTLTPNQQSLWGKIFEGQIQTGPLGGVYPAQTADSFDYEVDCREVGFDYPRERHEFNL